MTFYRVSCVFQCEMCGYKSWVTTVRTSLSQFVNTYKQERTVKVLFIVFLCERSERTDKVKQ